MTVFYVIFIYFYDRFLAQFSINDLKKWILVQKFYFDADLDFDEIYEIRDKLWVRSQFFT